MGLQWPPIGRCSSPTLLGSRRFGYSHIPIYCSLLLDGATTVSREEHHIYSFFVRQFDQRPVFWGEYTSTGRQDAEWLCGVLETVVMELRATNSYAVAVTSGSAGAAVPAVESFNRRHSPGREIPAYARDPEEELRVLPMEQRVRVSESGSSEVESESWSSDSSPQAEGGRGGEATASSESSSSDISVADGQAEGGRPPPPPDQLLPVQYILHYRCACHTLSLVCDTLLTRLGLVDTINSALEELETRRSTQRKLRPPTRTPTRWGSIYPRLAYVAREAQEAGVPSAEALKSALDPIEILNGAIKVLESDSADLVTVHTALAGVQRAIAEKNTPTHGLLRALLESREQGHFNIYKVLDVVRLLTFQGAAPPGPPPETMSAAPRRRRPAPGAGRSGL